MKWLLYVGIGVVGVVLVAVLVLLAVGGGRGVSRHVATIEIERPVDVVFRWISEPARQQAWVGWLVEIRPLTPTTAEPGSRLVWVMEDRNNNSQRMDVHTEITRAEPGRLLEARVSAHEGFDGTVAYELQPTGDGGTHLTYRATFHYQHWLAKLLEPVISRSAQQKLQEDLERLKQLAEAEAD